MKIPKSFRTKDKGKIEEYLKFKPNEGNPKNIEKLLEGYDMFLKVKSNRISQYYNIARNIVNEIEFTKLDIKAFAKNKDFIRDSKKTAGYFISAMVNNALKSGESITLDVAKQYTAIGAYLNGKTLIIRGSVGADAGQYMKDGKLVIEGNAGSYLGHCMAGGEIWVHGQIEFISYAFRRGAIYQYVNHDWKKIQ